MAVGALLLPSAVGRRDVFTSKERDELGRQPLGVSLPNSRYTREVSRSGGGGCHAFAREAQLILGRLLGIYGRARRIRC